MNGKKQINDRWLKAAVLGTTWAASEIVFGSFLHNLRIPFSGNILTAIGLIILISASYKWRDSGIFWRAGLICALMKTVSPSAIIFGPLIAIFTEALLLEISVFLLGKNILGFLLGSALAMTWVLAQRILNLIIFYGGNIIDIYTSLMKMAEKQLNINTDLVWLPIILLVGIHILFGLLAGFLGIKTGKKLNTSPSYNKRPEEGDFRITAKQVEAPFEYSILWLWINLILIVGSLLLLSFTPYFVWAPVVIIIVFLWTTRYKSAIRHLSKPKFWVFFALITMLAALVAASLQQEHDSLVNGLISGLQMNFRAAIVIIGFSILGKELYNPKIISFFQKSSYNQLHLALELSFQSVPVVISQLPSFKYFLRNPASAIGSLLENADIQINNLINQNKNTAVIYIITGQIAEGKTSFIKEMVTIFDSNKIALSGLYSERIVENQETTGFDLVNVKTKTNHPFLRTGDENQIEKIGKYSILPTGLSIGLEILKPENCRNSQLLIIDEVGKLELQDRGWATAIPQLISMEIPLVIAVRLNFVNEIINHWNITNYQIIELAKHSPVDVSNMIINKIKNN